MSVFDINPAKLLTSTCLLDCTFLQSRPHGSSLCQIAHFYRQDCLLHPRPPHRHRHPNAGARALRLEVGGAEEDAERAEVPEPTVSECTSGGGEQEGWKGKNNHVKE